MTSKRFKTMTEEECVDMLLGFSILVIVSIFVLTIKGSLVWITWNYVVSDIFQIKRISLFQGIIVVIFFTLFLPYLLFSSFSSENCETPEASGKPSNMEMKMYYDLPID